MISLRRLGADLVARVSAVRASLLGNRSHRFKVSVYKWWDTVLGKSHSSAMGRLNMNDAIIRRGYRSFELRQQEPPGIARQCSRDGLS